MQEMTVVQALTNIREAIRVFKGTADEHQVLARSFEMVAKSVVIEPEVEAEVKEEE